MRRRARQRGRLTSFDLGHDVWILLDFDGQCELKLAVFNTANGALKGVDNQMDNTLQLKLLVDDTVATKRGFWGRYEMNAVVERDCDLSWFLRQWDTQVSQSHDCVSMRN